MAKWEELDRTVRKMEEHFERSKYNMPYSERAEMEHEINVLRDVAREERDKYVRWLWGY